MHHERIALFKIENDGLEAALVTLCWCPSWVYKPPADWRI